MEYILGHLISSAPMLTDAALSMAFGASFCTSVSHEIHELEGATCPALRNMSPPRRLLNNDAELEEAGCRHCGQFF